MMNNRAPAAGGFFIFLAVCVGMVWGAATGQATRGVLIGTVVGVAIAALIWLVDRRRG